MRRKTIRRRVIRSGLLAVNVAILAVIILFVLHDPQPTNAVKTPAILDNKAVTSAINPLDQLASADVALTAALMNGLPEATAINNQADSQKAELTLASAINNSVVSKPQVINTQLKSRANIENYTAVNGDTISSIATKFGITSDSIRWSNGLSGNSVVVGAKLVIPPVNGIVYKVKSGDTPESLASKYSASRDQIIAYNDGEIGGLRVGEQIIIPNATIAAPVGGGASTANVGLAWGTLATYGSNGSGYDRGWCTYYASAKAGAPGGWGNANTWHLYAPLSGWTVSTTPRVGAVAQNSYGWAGHVGVVDAVSADGTMIKYSDMNGLAGFNRVGYSEWVPAIGKFQRFIYR